jgi:hypothetical protein
MIRINVLVRNVSASVGHLEVTVKRNEVFGYLFYLNVRSVGDAVCALDCVASSMGGFLRLCFVLSLCDYFIKYRIFYGVV